MGRAILIIHLRAQNMDHAQHALNYYFNSEGTIEGYKCENAI